MTDSPETLPFDENIQHIVCAVRGLPESYKTVSAAITLAKEQAARLTFLLILDAEFLGTSAPVIGSLATVRRQLTQLGEFTLLSLCDEAERRGVPRVSGVVRLGDFASELRTYLGESHADVLVMSRLPVGVGLPEDVFDALLADLQAMGLTLQIVEPHLNGPAGDLPAIFHLGATGETQVLCAQGPAPAGVRGTLVAGRDPVHAAMSTQTIDFFARQFERQIAAADYALNPFETWILPHLSGRVLDLGCGLGNLSLAAARAGHEVDALDGCAQAVADLARRAQALALPVRVGQADLQHWRAGRCWDSVVSLSVALLV